MNLSEFNALQEQERYDVTFRQGTFIDYRLNGKKRFALYAVSMFFVEVVYNITENKKYKEFRTWYAS